MVSKVSWPAVAALFACIVQAAGVERTGPISIYRIEGVREFADATTPGAIRRACADSRADLEAFFAARQSRFDPNLLLRAHGRPFCHVYYEPTLPGFRASSDEDPIMGVFGAVDPGTFVAGREPVGDSLEILKFILQRVPEPLRVTLTVIEDYDPRHWPAALARHFPNTRHQLHTRPSRAQGTQPWAQDYLKSGWADGEQKLLVPHRLFEGRAHDGDVFRPLLDGLEEGRLVRSKLSWEGGDLQFARDPRDPARLILFYGSSALAYWGHGLEPAEYAYVLRTEFGADLSVDMSGLSGHVDYVLTLLPHDRTVLLSAPVRGNAALAEAAARALTDVWGENAPKSLSLLTLALERAAWPERIRQRIAEINKQALELDLDLEPALAAELDAYTGEHCPKNDDDCFGPEGRAAMLERNPGLLKRALNAILNTTVRADLTPRLLGLIEAQYRTEPWPREALLDRKATELEGLGFRVVRIPHLRAENAGAWPGVSYANSLVLDRTIFVPALGLGAYEERVFRDLATQLGPEYTVTPVPARFALLRNGGVHCVFGLVRGAPTAPPTD